MSLAQFENHMGNIGRQNARLAIPVKGLQQKLLKRGAEFYFLSRFDHHMDHIFYHLDPLQSH